jgi:putative oxidoreductase
VIQLVMWEGWPIHLTWAAMALGVIALGAGRLSLDNSLFNRHR